MNLTALNQLLRKIAPTNCFASLRYSRNVTEELCVRQGIVEPPQCSQDDGIMVTIHNNGGIGYGATGDTSMDGVKAATALAIRWAELSASQAVMKFDERTLPSNQGQYASPVTQPWEGESVGDKLERLQRACTLLKSDDKIVDWSASLLNSDWRQLYVCTGGSAIEQQFNLINPALEVVAHHDGLTQSRSAYGRGYCKQAGLEALDQMAFEAKALQMSEEVLALLHAPDCPSSKMDLLLAPDQMILQIHESIGHPLELDRILGDERNYAGTSFVTPEMFGNYQYGSELLNISFDPSVPGEFASYNFDDDGVRAEKTFIIEDGVLKTGLGSAISQHRSGLAGVANSRATSWNRAPIDRMANLNLETGSSTLEEMISAVEYGVMMHTNCSWSIDDSRNKFQFGCEYGQLIENGELKGVVRNPNYRGISASFWRNLKMVGNAQTQEYLGTPFCGKGEPNQVISVGHGSPTCLFSGIDVFGGEA